MDAFRLPRRGGMPRSTYGGAFQGAIDQEGANGDDPIAAAVNQPAAD
jgi:hypothetical protein